MIHLHYYPTPNGRKASIALEETGLPYRIVPVDILAGEQGSDAFRAINPNGRIPALIDDDVEGGPVTLFESGAILQHVARRSGMLHGAGEAQRGLIDSWLFWQMAGLGPMAGQLSWFLRVSNIPGRDPRDHDYAVHRYRKEVRRLYGVLEHRLNGRDFLCDAYSIADIACWTWIDQYADQIGGLEAYPGIARWHGAIAARPAVRRGMTVWMPESDRGWSAAGNAAQIARGAAKRGADTHPAPIGP